MKKTSILLTLGLLVVGCEGAKPAPAPVAPPNPASHAGNPAMMKMHAPPGAGTEEKKDEEKKADAPADGDKAPEAPK